MEGESSIMSSAKQLPVRVIARLDKKIFIDPNPLIAKYSSHMWVLHSRPIADLQWDPLDYGWKLPMSDNTQAKVLPFFAYSVSLGRKVLLNEIDSILVGKKY